MKVVILGGYGVFGGHLARFLFERGHEVLVAGRSATRAQAFCTDHGGTPLVLDRSDAAFGAAVQKARPDVIVDAAGPFQAYDGAPVIEAALAAGAHYLDLSDDAAFTEGVASFDQRAREAGLTVLSGVSSVPAISSAAVAILRNCIEDIALIDSAICPGNRAPRGRSVMRAILGQIGAPLRLWRGGRWVTAPGWAETRHVDLGPGLTRPAALIGAPDLALFPGWTGARSVLFRAGLELPVMHRALRVLSWLRARRLIPAPVRATALFHWVARLLEPFGSDRGGMAVCVSGRVNGRPETRRWRAVAEGGVGPRIPAIPALIAVEMLAAGNLASGARPALGDIPLDRIEREMDALGIATERDTQPAPRLFEAALGARWDRMPAPWRRLHDIWDQEVFTGRARVTRGTSALSHIIASLFRFPVAGEGVPLTVTMTRHNGGEVWLREFDRARFHSVLSPAGPDAFHERFGPFTFRIALTGDDSVLGMRVISGSVLGVPVPRALLPGSVVREEVIDGRFHFDVDLTHPLAGRLVRYQGWLAPVSPER